MLLRDQAGADTGAQVLIEEAGGDGGVDVLPALEEAAGEDGDGVSVGLHEAGHKVDEGVFISRGADLALGEREKGREGMHVIVVDLGDMGVRDDDEGEVAEGLDAVREASGEDRQRKIGRGLEGGL